MNTDQKEEVFAKARRMRRVLRISVRCCVSGGMTKRDLALHEAGHCVITLALRGEVACVHIGNSFGGTETSFAPIDGFTLGINLPFNSGVFAVAGMVQSNTEWIGFGDASILLQYIHSQLGPWPSKESETVDGIIREARTKAGRLLKAHRGAIEPLADLLETGTQFNGISIRKLVKSYSPSIPDACATTRLAHAAWQKALNGHAGAIETCDLMGLGEVVKLATKERTMRK